jgi:hypothetical protein
VKAALAAAAAPRLRVRRIREVSATVEIDRVVGHTNPRNLGFGCSTYGDTALTSATLAAGERRLDARSVRIPVGLREGRVTSSAAGGPTDLDVPALVGAYRSWGYRVLAVVGGRTRDGDVQPGDASRIIESLGVDGVEYSSPNEPDTSGQTLADAVETAQMIWREGQGLVDGFRLWGPAWGSYDRAVLRHVMRTMGDRLAGVDFHRYAMGQTSLSTDAALRGTQSYRQCVTEVLADLSSAHLPTAVNVTEMNLSWRVEDGTPPTGRNERFYTAVNAVWMASAIGATLSAGGRATPYANVNSALGIMFDADERGRTKHSFMPAAWGIAAWTGAGLWPHYKSRFFATTTTVSTVETYAVDNEADGHNIVVINRERHAGVTYSAMVSGVPAARFDLWQTDPDRPFDEPRRLPGEHTGGLLRLELPPLSVTVMASAAP